MFELEAWLLIVIVPSYLSSEEDATLLLFEGTIKLKVWNTLQDLGVYSFEFNSYYESELGITLLGLAWLLQNSLSF